MTFLNLGILAHVDAGKTSLTERILFQTGAIKAPGRVDHGNTQTDTLAQERARGITIKSAVVSFDLGDLTVNLIDTPGHADFIAEVQRSLLVLDAVVLVVSAVEGIQPQTRKLAKAIRARGIPTIVFINKIDRIGARFEQVLADLGTTLGLRPVPFAIPHAMGTNDAFVSPISPTDGAWRDRTISLLADSSDEFTALWLDADGQLDDRTIETELQTQIGNATVMPVFAGSATRGVGVDLVLAGIADLFPKLERDVTGLARGIVFKIDRTATGEKLVYARVDAGVLSVRDQIRLSRLPDAGGRTEISERIKGLDQFRNGTARPAQSAEAGEIVRLHGLAGARIGDRFGDCEGGDRRGDVAIELPRLESVITANEPAQANSLHTSLLILAESDPLINLQPNELTGELSLRLFGEIQQEVVLETLRADYGLAATFGETAPICIERPIGIGRALETVGTPTNPFWATVGLCIEPGPLGSGFTYHRELGSLPPAYYRVLEETLRATLTEGLHGWGVTDIVVTLETVGYAPPLTHGTDFRRLVPMVLMDALDLAGTSVCEPIESFEVMAPLDALGEIVNLLIVGGAMPMATDPEGDLVRVTGTVPTGRIHSIERRIFGVGRGMTSMTSEFLRYDPVIGPVPERTRRSIDPRNRAEYLASFGLTM